MRTNWNTTSAGRSGSSGGNAEPGRRPPRRSGRARVTRAPPRAARPSTSHTSSSSRSSQSSRKKESSRASTASSTTSIKNEPTRKKAARPPKSSRSHSPVYVRMPHSLSQKAEHNGLLRLLYGSLSKSKYIPRIPMSPHLALLRARNANPFALCKGEVQPQPPKTAPLLVNRPGAWKGGDNHVLEMTHGFINDEVQRQRLFSSVKMMPNQLVTSLAKACTARKRRRLDRGNVDMGMGLGMNLGMDMAEPVLHHFQQNNNHGVPRDRDRPRTNTAADILRAHTSIATSGQGSQQHSNAVAALQQAASSNRFSPHQNGRRHPQQQQPHMHGTPGGDLNSEALLLQALSPNAARLLDGRSSGALSFSVPPSPMLFRYGMMMSPSPPSVGSRFQHPSTSTPGGSQANVGSVPNTMASNPGIVWKGAGATTLELAAAGASRQQQQNHLQQPHHSVTTPSSAQRHCHTYGKGGQPPPLEAVQRDLSPIASQLMRLRDNFWTQGGRAHEQSKKNQYRGGGGGTERNVQTTYRGAEGMKHGRQQGTGNAVTPAQSHHGRADLNSFLGTGNRNNAHGLGVADGLGVEQMLAFAKSARMGVPHSTAALGTSTWRSDIIRNPKQHTQRAIN